MEKKFPALRTIAVIFKILGWLVLVVAVIAMVVVLISGGEYGFQYSGLVKVGLSVAILLGGALYLLFFYAAAEAILVLLAIEENTRK